MVLSILQTLKSPFPVMKHHIITEPFPNFSVRVNIEILVLSDNFYTNNDLP